MVEAEAAPVREIEIVVGNETQQWQQAGGDFTCEREAVVSSAASLQASQSSNIIPFDEEEQQPQRTPTRWRLRQAEEQVAEARQELAIVEAQLDSLQNRHAQEIRELDRQVLEDSATRQELQQTVSEQKLHIEALHGQLRLTQDENMTLSDQVKELQHLEQNDKKNLHTQLDELKEDYERQLQALQADKLVAETRLDEALQQLEAANAQLESSNKRVRFAEEQNQVLEYQVNEYKLKLEDSESKVARLKQSIDSIQKEHTTLQETHRNVLNFQETVHSLRSVELDTSKQQHLQSQRQLEVLQSTHQQLEASMKGMKEERSNLQQELSKTSNQWQQTKELLSKKDEEARKLQEELRSFQQTVKALTENQF